MSVDIIFWRDRTHSCSVGLRESGRVWSVTKGPFDMSSNFSFCAGSMEALRMGLCKKGVTCACRECLWLRCIMWNSISDLCVRVMKGSCCKLLGRITTCVRGLLTLPNMSRMDENVLRDASAFMMARTAFSWVERIFFAKNSARSFNNCFRRLLLCFLHVFQDDLVDFRREWIRVGSVFWLSLSEMFVSWCSCCRWDQWNIFLVTYSIFTSNMHMYARFHAVWGTKVVN